MELLSLFDQDIFRQHHSHDMIHMIYQYKKRRIYE